MIIFALVFYLLLAIGVALNWMPLWLLIGYGGLGLAAFVVFGLDKRAALKDKPRTAEIKLWLLALVGGFGGAMLAMALFRHKTSKRGFLWPFYAATLLHLLLALGAFYYVTAAAPVQG